MKALIVIDIDESHLFKESNDLFERLQGYECELKPIPEKRVLPHEMVDYTNYGEEPWFTDGWNACIEEILK